VVGATATAGGRLRTGVANDARSVAGTAAAAGRRLRPDPQPLVDDDTLMAAPLARTAVTETSTDGAGRISARPAVAVPAGVAVGMTTAFPAPDEPTAELPVVPGNLVTIASTATPRLAPPGPAAPTAVGSPEPIPGSGTGTPTDNDAPPAASLGRGAGVAAPTGANGNGARGRTTGGGTRRQPGPSVGTGKGSLGGFRPPGHAPAGAASRPGPRTPNRGAARRRRDGVVVPLRVPWRTRLRAVAGLVALVVVLGATAAVIVAAVAIAAAQALGNV
jgi:hypothetical protein